MPRTTIAICIDESTDQRIVISGLQVVETSFGIIIVSTIPQRVNACHGSGSGKDFTVRIIGICSNAGSACVYKVHYIAHLVGDVVIGRSVIGQGEGIAVGSVGEVPGVCTVGLLQEFSAGVQVAVGLGSDCLAGTDPVQVVGIRNTGSGLACGSQLSAIAPAKSPSGSVVVADGIAADCRTGDGVGGAVVGLALVGDTVTVECGQQVCPAGISVGISMVLIGLGIIAVVDIPVDQIAGVIVEVLIPVVCHTRGRIHRCIAKLIE